MLQLRIRTDSCGFFFGSLSGIFVTCWVRIRILCCSELRLKPSKICIYPNFFTNLSIKSIYLSIELREKWPYLQNYHSKKNFNTVHTLIAFSFVFTKKIFFFFFMSNSALEEGVKSRCTLLLYFVLITLLVKIG